MFKTIIISGSVGTGKTTLAKKLAKKLDCRYLDVNQLIKENKLSESYDKKRKCKVIDIKKLNPILTKEINKTKTEKKHKGIIIDSHMSHFLPKKYVNMAIITKCNLKTLAKRLKKRHYNKKKITENLECEIFDVCLNEAKEQGYKIKIIDTTNGIDIVSILKKLRLH